VSSTRGYARAFVATMVTVLPTLFACASGGATHTDPGAVAAAGIQDTMRNVNTDGKKIEDLFAGKFPGVEVARTDGGGLQFRIRGGVGSFYGNDDPLIVIDEVPQQPGSHGVVFLNPHDIERIDVLKNPADTGIYGMRGANGVIKIRTKRPGRP